MKMTNKTIGILLILCFLSTFFAGYSIGWNRGWDRGAEFVEGEVIKAIDDAFNRKLELLEKGYNSPWWGANWTGRIKDNETWVYYTENCTKNQINEFIGENLSFYDDFSGCSITSSG